MRKKVPLEVKMEALKLLQSGESANAVSKQLSISNGELQTWSLIYAKKVNVAWLFILKMYALVK